MLSNFKGRRSKLDCNKRRIFCLVQFVIHQTAHWLFGVRNSIFLRTWQTKNQLKEMAYQGPKLQRQVCHCSRRHVAPQLGWRLLGFLADATHLSFTSSFCCNLGAKKYKFLDWHRSSSKFYSSLCSIPFLNWELYCRDFDLGKLRTSDSNPRLDAFKFASFTDHISQRPILQLAWSWALHCSNCLAF